MRRLLFRQSLPILTGLIASLLPVGHFFGTGFDGGFCDHWFLGWPLGTSLLQHGTRWHIEIDSLSLIVNFLAWYLATIAIQFAYRHYLKRKPKPDG
jgi:hypothetical protein